MNKLDRYTDIKSLRCLTRQPYILSIGFFQIKVFSGFITSCYVIFSLSMVQAMDIFMIT